TPSGEEPDASRLQLIDRPYQLHHTLSHPRAPFRRLEELTHRPVHVGCHCGSELHFWGQRRIDVRQAGEDALQPQLDTTARARSVQLRGERLLDRAAALVAEDDEERRVAVGPGVLQ